MDKVELRPKSLIGAGAAKAEEVTAAINPAIGAVIKVARISSVFKGLVFIVLSKK
jgi:hypothetical protein